MKNSVIISIIAVALVSLGVVIALSQNKNTETETSSSNTSTSSMTENTNQTNNEKTMKNIVEIAMADGRFTKLVAAVKAADLVGTLTSEGPFTVFAPTDDAFNALGEDTLNAVLADKAKLTSILTYHVVPEKLMAADVLSKKTLVTAQGGELTVTSEPSPKVNDANIVITDIEASNGVIHVIDKVLLPK